MNRAVCTALLLVACEHLPTVPPDQYCKEAGFSIASRTFECTDDPGLANDRYEAFAQTYTCREWDLSRENQLQAPVEADLFHCAFAIDALSCGEVRACGDDLDCWLAASPTCALVVKGLPADTGSTP